MTIPTQTKEIVVFTLVSITALSIGALLAFRNPGRQMKTKLLASVSAKKGTTTETKNKNPNISSVVVPQAKDTDEDGLSDDEEKRYGTNPFSPDTDGDGYQDGEEVKNGYSPLEPMSSQKQPTSSNRNIALASREPSTHPTACSTPIKNSNKQISAPDKDSDGLADDLELQYNTDPNNPDTDGDGYQDGEEVKNGYSPTSSRPIKLTQNHIKAVLFYGQECSFSQQVLQYIQKNNITDKISLEKKEVFHNPSNARLLEQTTRACGIKTKPTVPLFSTRDKCYSGVEKIINFLKPFASQEIAQGGRRLTSASSLNSKEKTNLNLQDLGIEDKAISEILLVNENDIKLTNQSDTATLQEYYKTLNNILESTLQEIEAQLNTQPVNKKIIKTIFAQSLNKLQNLETPRNALEAHKIALSLLKYYEKLTNLDKDELSNNPDLQAEALDYIIAIQALTKRLKNFSI